MQLLSLKPEKFGLDIKDSSVKVVQLKERPHGFLLSSFNEERIEPGIVQDGVIKDEEKLSGIIRDLCKNAKGNKIRTKYVVSALPEEKSFSQVIQMPSMDEEDMKGAVMFEAENYIPLTIDKVYLDFQLINSDQRQNKCNLLIAATPKPIVDSYVSCIKKAGLIPYVLEPESQSVARALVLNRPDTKPIAIIDLRKESTNFIVYAGKSVRFTCSLPVTSEQITGQIAQKLSIPREKAEELKMKSGLLRNAECADEIQKAVKPVLDEFVFQIKKYINFYKDHILVEFFSRDEMLDKIILSGGGANFKGFADFLSREMHITVETGNSLLNFIEMKNPYFDKQRSLSFVTSLGLAMRN